MNDNPLVSVCILSFNRKSELRHTLRKIYEQDYHNIEIIVVDNSSTDGSPEMINEEFPNVNLIKLNENIGAPGINFGFRVANGDFILILDDDSYPVNDVIKLAVNSFQVDINIGIIACNIIHPLEGTSETGNFSMFPNTFVGCGALFRKRHLDKIGYYDENLFLYMNEIDLSARLLDCGYKIKYENYLVVYHTVSPKNRLEDELGFNYIRYNNEFWGMFYFLFTKFSFLPCTIAILKLLISEFLTALYKNKIQLFLANLYCILCRLSTLLKNRKVLKKETQAIYNYGRIFPLFTKNESLW